MTALCVASAITLATTAYAANGGLSNWDMQSHPSGKNNQGNKWTVYQTEKPSLEIWYFNSLC